MKKILIRFDDICPTMNWHEWEKAEKVLINYNVKPLMGIIPECKDPELQIMEPRKDFWDYIQELADRGYIFAMHGYEHLYDSNYRGMVNSGFKSEFAGHTYETQLKKIKAGKDILENHGIDTNIFFAPAHSYDKNTLKALYKCGFKYISDGKSSQIIIRYGIKCIPCKCGGVPKIKKSGLYTAVFHVHEWTRPEKNMGLSNLINLCESYESDITDFYELADSYKQGIEIYQKISEYMYVMYERYIRPKLSKCKQLLIKFMYVNR